MLMLQSFCVLCVDLKPVIESTKEDRCIVCVFSVESLFQNGLS